MAHHQHFSRNRQLTDLQAALMARDVIENARFALRCELAGGPYRRVSGAIGRKLRLPLLVLGVYPEYTVAICLLLIAIAVMVRPLY
jgi:hypothetical protein